MYVKNIGVLIEKKIGEGVIMEPNTKFSKEGMKIIKE